MTNRTSMISLRLTLTRALYVLALLCCALSVSATHSPLRFQLPAVSAPGVEVSARIYSVPELSKDKYWDKVVLVKTKSKQHLGDGALSFQSLAWQQTLSPLSVQSLRAPYKLAAEGPSIQENDPFGIERIFELHYSVDVDPYDACELIAQNPDVEYVVPVFKRYFFSTPSDALVSQQYALTKIQASQAWDINTGSTSVVIADVDSGVDFEHEDLAANLWINTGETGKDGQGRDKSSNGVDDDKDGFIDDFRGWDFIGNVSQLEAANGVTRPDNDPKVRNANMDPELNHGTMTTGCATAVTNNSKGVAGTGYQCKYLPIKCGSDQFGTAVMYGYEGMNYAAKMGAKIINCSWGGPGSSQAEQDIINAITSKGVLIVVAAGNASLNMDDSLQFPACYDNVLTVGSSDQNDKRSGFSNYGRRVDVFAPGTAILSTMSPNKYGVLDGTSFSCPIVSGICGLVRSMHPTWTPRQVIHQLRSTCDNVITSIPSQRPQNYGRVNAYRALNENRDLNPGTMPGLEISSMTFGGEPQLMSDTPVEAVFNLRNYLGKASNAVITITPTSNAIKLSQNTFNLASIPAADSISLKCTISTANPTYFRTNTVPATVTMSADGYVNYQLVNIEVNLNSEATYAVYAKTPAVSYTAGFAKAPVTFWAIGKTTSGRKAVMHGTSIDSTLSDDLSCVCALSSSSALVGSALGRVFRTTNSATSWTNTSVSSVTSKVLSINMADASNGVLLGNPTAGSWNVGVTTDGGATWKKSTSITSSLNGETAQTNSVVWVGDNVWIGTSAGRILYSTNRGLAWQTSTISNAAVLTQLSFGTNKVGFAISRPTGTLTEAATVYISLDGGLNWGPSGYSFPASGLHPVYAYVPQNSSQYVIVGSGSEVIVSTDSAKTFRPIISENGLSATSGAAISSSTQVSLYILGKTVGLLKFPIVNGAGVGVLSVPTSLIFDTTNIDASQTKSVQIKNSGTAALNVTAYSVTPDVGTTADDFTLSGSVSQVGVGETGTLFVKFSPGGVGPRSATLNISSSVGNKSVALRGVGRDLSNPVEEIGTQTSELRLFPNPAEDLCRVELSSTPGEQLELRLLDLQGRLVQSLYKGQADSRTFGVQMSARELASGLYVCEALTARGVQRCLLRVQH